MHMHTQIIRLFLITALAVGFGSSVAAAQSYTDIDISIDGDSVSVSGSGVDVDVDEDSVHVTSDGVDVTVAGDSDDDDDVDDDSDDDIDEDIDDDSDDSSHFKIDNDGDIDIMVDGQRIKIEDDKIEIKGEDGSIKIEDDRIDVETSHQDGSESKIRIDDGIQITNTNSFRAEEQVSIRVKSGQDGSVEVQNGVVEIFIGDGDIAVSVKEGHVEIAQEAIRAGGLSRVEENTAIDNRFLAEMEQELVAEIIFDESDFDIYVEALEEETFITEIEIDEDEIEFSYVQPGKLFGFIGIDMGATVIVDEDDAVEIDLPWYSFLVKKDVKVVEAAVAAGVKSQVTTEHEFEDEARSTVVKQSSIVGSIANTLRGHFISIAMMEEIEIEVDEDTVEVGDDGVSVNTGETSVEVSEDGVSVSTEDTNVDVTEEGVDIDVDGLNIHVGEDGVDMTNL